MSDRTFDLAVIDELTEEVERQKRIANKWRTIAENLQLKLDALKANREACMLPKESIPITRPAQAEGGPWKL